MLKWLYRAIEIIKIRGIILYNSNIEYKYSKNQYNRYKRREIYHEFN